MPVPYLPGSTHLYAGSKPEFRGRLVKVTHAYIIGETVRYKLHNLLGENFDLDQVSHYSLRPVTIHLR
jgi:hypothetical protein